MDGLVEGRGDVAAGSSVKGVARGDEVSMSPRAASS